MVSVSCRFLFLLVLGMGCSFLLWHSLGLPLIILTKHYTPTDATTNGSQIMSSVVRRRTSSVHIFETSSPLKPLDQSKAKFHVEPPWEGGTKVYINDPGHMTKMAAMPIYGKNPSKIFFSGTG